MCLSLHHHEKRKYNDFVGGTQASSLCVTITCIMNLFVMMIVFLCGFLGCCVFFCSCSDGT